MVTAILILVALVLVVATVGMVVMAVRGDLGAQLWFAFGGLGQMIEVIAKIVPAIIEGFADQS